MDRDHTRAPDLADMLGGETPDATAEDAPSFLSFERCGRSFAVDAHVVEAIVKTPPVTSIPYPPPSVAGVAPVRGRVRIVICPANEPDTPSARLVLLSGDGQLALAADRVAGIVADPANADTLNPEDLIAG
ncbi:MAG TPA: chemotaxis protein CheW [Blastocatellia bacterium]|nr:chemotaxis protein CheW [Blastocatellia bacterium]